MRSLGHWPVRVALITPGVACDPALPRLQAGLVAEGVLLTIGFCEALVAAYA